MKLYGALHLNSGVQIVHKGGGEGRGLMSVKRFVQKEENSLVYVGSSEFRGTAAAEAINTEGITSAEFKKQKTQELKQNWSEKKMRGQFVGETSEEVDKDNDKTWQWLSKGDLKIGTETLLGAAQAKLYKAPY